MAGWTVLLVALAWAALNLLQWHLNRRTVKRITRERDYFATELVREMTGERNGDIVAADVELVLRKPRVVHAFRAVGRWKAPR